MGHKPNSLIKSRGRRRFLMGGAAALALPFLESLATPTPSYAWTPAAGMPHRLVIFFNGLCQSHFINLHSLIVPHWFQLTGIFKSSAQFSSYS